MLFFALLLAGYVPPLYASDIPAGGTIVAGNGTINSNGTDMTISQRSENMVIDWQDFSIGENNSVTFDQPSSTSAALNRVISSEVSHIQGAFKANGRVFIINPAGVVFGGSSQVNVGDLIISTLDIGNDDFMSGNYAFNGDSPGRIVNRGDITASGGGYVVMIAAKIENTGNITANEGGVLLGAGSRVVLDPGGPVKLQVEEAAIDAIIEQGGAIRADGGLVYITAKAAGDLKTTVINHTGITEARTLSSGENGEIYLMGDMENDRIAVGGTLDASAPLGADGGFIETSAAKMNIDDDIHVTTKAEDGETGTWLIDPTDFTIAASGGDMTGTEISTSLETSNVEIQSTGDGDGDGDIFVDDSITWTSGILTLNAGRNVVISSELYGSGLAKLVLYYGQGDSPSGNAAYMVKAPINLPDGYSFFTKLGRDGIERTYYVINELGAQGSRTKTDLQGISGKPQGFFALGSDIDASETAEWNGGSGFDPIGNYNGYSPSNQFTGRFDGLGHTITGLTVNRPATDYAGLFGYVNGADIRNLGIDEASITGNNRVGGLAGYIFFGTIGGVSFEGTVEGHSYVGGLAGYTNSNSTVTNTCAGGNVSGETYVGGLTGYNKGGSSIENSFSAAAVTGTGDYCGGLTGRNTGAIDSSYWDIDASGMSVSAGGSGATTSQMQSPGTFVGWDISDSADDRSTWRLGPGTGYPRLRFMTKASETSYTQAANVLPPNHVIAPIIRECYLTGRPGISLDSDWLLLFRKYWAIRLLPELTTTEKER